MKRKDMQGSFPPDFVKQHKRIETKGSPTNLGKQFSRALPVPDSLSESRIPVSLYQIDDIICNRYRVLEKPDGTTCNSTIIYCLDLRERTPCVLKEVPARFYEEARRFATIPLHPNVVKLRRLEVVGGSVLMVQDWMPNDLSMQLHKGMSEAQITDIILSVCRGLKHCIRFLSSSDNVFVHGDIKPENIFIASDETIKLADFAEGYFTRGYAAPEQLNGGPVDYRADIFSIGCLMKELSKLCEDTRFTNKLTDLAKACKRPNPDERIQSVDEIYRALSDMDIEELPVGGLSTSQLRNLTLIGEKIDVFDLLNRINGADSDELCDIAEVLLNINQPGLAIQVYGRVKFGDRDIRVSAGLAKAYAILGDWDNAIYASEKAMKLMPTDYRTIYIHINALYNKAVEEIERPLPQNVNGGQKESMLSFIDLSPNGPQIRKAFLTIADTLETLHQKFPSHREPLRLLGYVYNVLAEREKEIKYYQTYLSTDRDDYESRFYYAMALYLSFDTSKAVEQFQLVAKYIENAESKSIGRGVMLAYCKYFMNDVVGYCSALRYIEEMAELISDKDINNYSYLIYKDAVICDCQIHDEEDVLPYFDQLSELEKSIKEGFSSDRLWCHDQLRKIEYYREEWNNMRYSDLSINIRHLIFLSYNYESFLYESLGDDEAVLNACDKMLEYDRSSSNGLYNKAVVLNRLGKKIESIPLYREAFRCEASQDKKEKIKLEEKRTLIAIHDNPDAFYGMLLEKAQNWYGSRPLELETLIQNYSLMFTDTIYMWLNDYTAKLMDGLLQEEYVFDRVYPVLSLLEALHDAVIPDFSSIEDPERIEIPITSSVKSIYTLGRPIDLAEASLQILNKLVKAAETTGIPFFLFNCLRLRGESFYDRKLGDRLDNLKKSMMDFQRILQLPESKLPEAIPHVAWAAHYLGKIHMDRIAENNNFAIAHEYLGFALSIYQTAGEHLNEARVLTSKAICFLIEGNYTESYKLATKALELMVEDKMVFGRANYILGMIFVFLTNLRNKHEKEIINEGIDAFENALIVFKEKTVEWFIATNCLASLYHARETLLHDGSWAMERYYRKKASHEKKKKLLDMQDFLGQKVF